MFYWRYVLPIVDPAEIDQVCVCVDILLSHSAGLARSRQNDKVIQKFPHEQDFRMGVESCKNKYHRSSRLSFFLERTGICKSRLLSSLSRKYLILSIRPI